VRKVSPLTLKQKTELEDFLKDRKRTPEETRRAQAILLLTEGGTEHFICSLTGFKKQYVFRLRAKYLSEGLPGLKTKMREPKSLLTRSQIENIKYVLANNIPSDFGINSEFWTTSILGELIERHHGVRYKSRTSYYLLFRQARFSYHNPGKKYENRDQEKIDVWKKETMKKLKKFDFNSDTVLLTEDEMMLTTQTTCQKVWLPSGKYPRIDVAANRKRRCIYGFLNIFTGEQHAFKTEGGNSQATCKVLNKIGKVYQKKKIVIIWDNARWHKSKEVKEFLTKTEHRFHLMNFPPYAPEENPQEHVWKAGRESVTHNKHIKNIDKVTDQFIDYLNKTKFDYKFLNLK
jgi:transposase